MPQDSTRGIEYSEKYFDDTYEYRHVILPKDISKEFNKGGKPPLLSETEWRNLGVQQSRGWTHYAVHGPEPHILLFRRPLGTDPATGIVNDAMRRKAKEKYEMEFMG